MARIRWYGPTVTVLITTLIVMIAGPNLARRVEHARTSEHINLVRESLSSNPSLAELSDAFRKVGRVVEPSVVHIEVYTRETPRRQGLQFFDEEDMRDWFFKQPRERERGQRERERKKFERWNRPQQSGTGSGWVYDQEGHIVTNYHVIKDADEITVRFYDGSERNASVKGFDDRTDIAILEVDADGLHPATPSREPVEQGDIVFAFGSPFRFKFSMSQGIVSGLGRRLYILGDHGYERFIQTDAAINPGNSGGPLTNIRGEVVGMNTAIASRTVTYNGVGFAIPIDMVKDHVEQIIHEGRVIRGYLGIWIETLDPKMARTFGFDGEGVLVINPIADGPAEDAGIQRGDIITKVGDMPVATSHELREIVAGYAPGSRVTVEIYRLDDPGNMTGRTRTVEVTIATLPDQIAQAEGEFRESLQEESDADLELLKKLGFESVVAFTEEMAERLEIAFTPGVFVQSIRPRSAAATVNIEQGQIVSQVMGVPVHSVEQLAEELAKRDLAHGVRVSVIHGGMPRFVLLELPGAEDDHVTGPE